VASGCCCCGRSIVALRLADILELVQSVSLVLGEMPDMAGRVLSMLLEVRGLFGVARGFCEMTYLVRFDSLELRAVWSSRHDWGGGVVVVVVV
jgi:hypothetical protein